ncbi:MAG: NADH-quinone oxidoreductase subunit L [Bdellovibrionaceae bacterium]|nr:NADH-quinone oxidoreductase subunit L [Pseudobdellovibrionaceae bacterium]|tara:strand:+ start:1398 stop:3314 length:1917 start_codon:yes stop_codon:yes gene_type:complete
MPSEWIALIPFFPLVGFLINGCWYLWGQNPVGKKAVDAKIAGAIASTFIFASFVVSLALFIQLGQLDESSRYFTQVLASWMSIGEFNINIGFRVDSLSTLFTLVITGVGTLIHIYSIGYMEHDEAPAKFFSYLNLFCFAMLVLVLGDSIPMTFFGWEGVGLCSYLLIGFWYTDMDKAIAGKKAFVANRVGDLGFLLGMFLIYTTYGTLNYSDLSQVVTEIPVTAMVVTSICLLLFVGCTGKSAQIPLYVWLPDAMAGPTPVSALIHAATMVTSGIYLVGRLNALFSMSPVAMSVIAWVGALTAFFAATIAIAQSDIKKVLAYSTVSQLGYMFLACGVGAFSTGIFHVITHAFFKALLFLGAGSVIHGMHHEQDMMKMGGLKSKMPQTFLVFVVGWLAICGIPPFSGFFSKDEILWKAFSSDHGSIGLYLMGAITAVMTAFYMSRMIYLTFFGEQRSDIKAHESPSVMVYPLFVLAALSFAGGWIGVPHMNWLEHWLLPVIPEEAPTSVSHSMEWVLMGLSVAGAAAGIFAARRVYQDLSLASELKQKFLKLHQILENKWYVDEVYESLFVQPIVRLSRWIWKVVDVQMIDGVVVGLGKLSMKTGQSLKVIQTGSIHVYAIMMLIGLLVTLGYVAYGLV